MTSLRVLAVASVPRPRWKCKLGGALTGRKQKSGSRHCLALPKLLLSVTQLVSVTHSETWARGVPPSEVTP